MYKYIFGFFGMMLCFSFVGGGDYDEAVKAEQRYIDRVCSGIHTDYENLKPEC